MSVRDEIAAVLASHPSARFDDGYYALRFDHSAFARLTELRVDAIDAYRAIFAELPRVLLLVQNLDPTPYLPVTVSVECETVFIATDPQLPFEERQQFYAASTGRELRIEAFLADASRCAGPCIAIDAKRSWALSFSVPQGVHCRDATGVSAVIERYRSHRF